MLYHSPASVVVNAVWTSAQQFNGDITTFSPTARKETYAPNIIKMPAGSLSLWIAQCNLGG